MHSVPVPAIFCLAALFAVTGCRKPSSRHMAPDSGSALRLGNRIAILVDREAPPPVHRAAEDLVRDLRNVLDADAQVVATLASVPPEHALIVVAGYGKVATAFGDPTLTDPESHLVTVRRHDGHRAVVLQGGDMRGTLYAMYTFSDRILDIPPLWFWSSFEPARREYIDIPSDTRIYYPAPSVRWRAWFPNDQDFLTEAWKRQEGHRDAMAETLLRLKLNAWDTGSVLDRDGISLTPDAMKAVERGILPMSTHTAPLGVRIDRGRWQRFWQSIMETDEPPLLISEADALVTYWTHGLRTISAQVEETLWTVTFRSDGDLPFWHFYADAPETDAGRAAVLQAMLDTQVDLLRKYGGTPQPIRIPFYNEMSDFMMDGRLAPPGGEGILWNFVSARRDHYPPRGIEDLPIPENQPIGLYFNMQFTSTGSHVVPGEGPWKMEANYRFLDGLSNRPLEFSKVNAGNIREFVMELEAYAAMMWDFNAYDSDRFLTTFCARYFGAEHAEAVAGLYRDFYHAYWQQRKPDRAGFDRQYIFHDLRYARAFREILPHIRAGRHTREPMTSGFAQANPDLFRIVPADSGAADTLEAIIKGTAASEAAMRRVASAADERMALLPPDRRAFFNDNLRIPAHFMTHLNASLHHLARALEKAGEKDVAREHLRKSLRRFQSARTVLQEAEHGAFSTWYPRRGQRMMFRFYDIEDGLQEALASFGADTSYRE